MMLFNNKPIDNKKYSEDILNEGFSIYEVCRVFRGKVIFLNDNLLRLDNSIKKSNLAIDLNSLHVADQLNRLIQLENIKEGNRTICLPDKTLLPDGRSLSTWSGHGDVPCHPRECRSEIYQFRITGNDKQDYSGTRSC